MSTYRQGEEWKKTLNENVFLKMRVTELEDENEALRVEIIEMRNAADKEDEILDEVIDSIDATMWHDPSGNEY